MKMQKDKECFLCRRWYGFSNDRNLEEHHIIYGTANRRISEREGLKVYLCAEHHRTGVDAVHRRREVAEMLIREAQTIYELDHSRDEWRKLFGKSWL